MKASEFFDSPQSRRAILKGAARAGVLLVGAQTASLLALGCSKSDGATLTNQTTSSSGTTGAAIPPPAEIDVVELLRQGGDLTTAIGTGLVAIPELHAEAVGAIVSALGAASIAAADIIGEVKKYSAGGMVPKDKAPTNHPWGSAGLSNDEIATRYLAFKGNSGTYKYPIIQASARGSGAPLTFQAEDGTNHSLILGMDNQTYETHNSWLYWLIHNGSGRDLEASGNVSHVRCETCEKGGFKVNVMKQNFTPRGGQEVELIRWDQRQPRNEDEKAAYRFHSDHTDAYLEAAEGRENENVRVENESTQSPTSGDDDPYPTDTDSPADSPTGEDTDIPTPPDDPSDTSSRPTQDTSS